MKMMVSPAVEPALCIFTEIPRQIDTANASDRKQYILITPQDMNNVNITNTVRVHRMTDPERGQGVLRFSGAS